jgi:EAL domain-containing protein (putative c-di-GMP-specific phosphodiesterase class I)
MGQAWASGRPQVVESYLLDARLQPWHALMQPLSVRSATAIPLQRGTAVEALLFILGAYPLQFNNPLLQVWLHAKQQRWTQLLAASDKARNSFDALHSAQWRGLLYQGGVRMVVQPIVDLHSARVTKVEALARLQTHTGELLSPAVFMPALGQADLRVLFRQALEQSLPFVRDWRKAGMEINLSLNLDPTTLLDPDCPIWVEQALRDADLPPAALTLELLETQEFDHRVVDEAISRLCALGVCLSMDDLGSGYSSMKRLTNLPFDVIKIDQDVIKCVFRSIVTAHSGRT